MASSLISSSHHIDFDSVFSMEDASLAPVFESLIITGLKEFLGCPAIFYEASLTEFFVNGSVRDGVVVSTIGGTAVEISESVFAATFELPSEGLTDLSDVPKNLVLMLGAYFLTPKIVNGSVRDGVVVSTIGGTAVEISESVFAATFELPSEGLTDLSDVPKNLVLMLGAYFLTPKSRQAKGFAIQIGVVLSNIPGLELGEPRAFPPPRVLNEKTVHRFFHINEQVGMEKTAASPPMKKTPKKRAVSKKRPVDSDAEVAPIVKKKRTTKGKPATTGLEALPLQTIEPTADVPDEQPSKPKRKSQKRKRRLVLDDVDDTSESAAEQPVAGTATGVQETSADAPVATQPAVAPADEDQPADDPDAIIEHILTQLDTTAATKGDDQPTAQAKDSIPWFDLPFKLARQDAEGLLSSDTDEEFIADQPTVTLFPDEGDQPQVFGNNKPVNEEHMSIDDILMQISEDMMLPSVTAAEIPKIRLGESISITGVQERDLFYASLPRISIHDKGKEILVEDEPVRGNPARETVELICGDVDFLFQLRDRVMEDVVQFFHSFSLNKLPDFDGLHALKAKESLMLEWAETDSLETLDSVDIQSIQEFESASSDGSTVYRSPYPILQKDDSFDQEELLYIVESPESSPSFPQRQESTTATVDHSSLLDDLKSSLFQRMDDANSEILSRLHSTERSLQTSLGHQNDYLRSLIQSVRQEGQTEDDVQLLRLNELKKAFLAQGVSAETNSLADRSRFNALDAKILFLDGQVAAIRNEQLEFQAKIAADLLSLSTQIGDLVDYIRGGDAKKGEGSSSRPPHSLPGSSSRPLQPPPADQIRDSGHVASLEELEEAAERMHEADRRERERDRHRR
ncbi:hypothetical protein F511_27243 [Dorcoceras hygrometricum]|uniref:Dystroglycan-like n=1 Tax=Dorcoceras hygrometricum TaxID=472368 RepID=A0A2Z7CB72_9LAMI|nr:hypothetical protein F511_27243 [Dorcoceras hygrometricum]